MFRWPTSREPDPEEIRFVTAAMANLPLVKAPDAVWASIEAALSVSPRGPAWTVPRLAWAGLAAAAVVAAAVWMTARTSSPRWQMVERQGARLTHATVGAGEWIETDPTSKAVVQVGAIGSVEVLPGTRLRVIAAQPTDHRLSLVRGEIHAKISAPPRLFFVETPSGIAVDLGCEYSLQTGEDGSGSLQVTKGWVSFQWKGIESLVPAGASCRTFAGAGPGIPYFDDAPEKLRRELDQRTNSLDVILREARVRDTLTLWHLLWRVDVAGRKRIYDRIAQLTPVPAGVSREKVLHLDPDTLTRWKEELAWTW